MTGDRDDARSAAVPARKAGFLQTMRAVLWSFFGVRKRAGYEQDAAQLNPVHVIIAGIIMAIIFVLVLVMVVRFVVS
jgi:heme/copper-type cytochrome/quinol oxidase subunit 2